MVIWSLILAVVTWCVGHLVTMSYPEKYDMKYKRWSFDTLPFLPRDFKYEVIPGVQKQFQIVKGPFKQTGYRDHLCVYGLWTGGRIYLPAGGTDGWCKRKRRKKSLD